jgi:carbon monoxide dehydrogenase subunit G
VQIENEFTVAAPVDDLWTFLLDVERIAPCMPGAELTETVDERTWKGKVNMKLGPVSLSFAGTVEMEERDDVAHRAKLRAKGMEQKGKGAANASVESWLEPAGDETTVKMVADIQLTGAVAQLSRGLLPEVSRRLTAQFADCLHETIVADTATKATGASRPDPGAEPSPGGAAGMAEPSPGGAAGMPEPSPGGAPAVRPPSTAAPIGGIRLALAAIASAIAKLFRRLLGHKA